jgi:cytochrome c553
MGTLFEPFFAGAVTLAAAAALIAAMAAQAPQSTTGTSPAPGRTFPAPTNLKVLPMDLTGQQVNALMEQWQAALGTRCSLCHAKDREKTDAGGEPLLDFAADSKPLKGVARIMFQMTEEINTRYVSRIDGSGVPVTCGTCHGGHLSPDPFVLPDDRKPTGAQGQPAESAQPQ